MSSSAHSQHLYYHASCSRSPNSPRPSSRQLSRDSPKEPARQTPVSSLLHERLQKERQSESQKLASSRMTNESNNSLDKMSGVQKSPTRSVGLDISRPNSGAGGEPAARKGLGIKEMEHVVSSLHKQNFDLKLELYHRRERQTMLEENMETLRSEKCAAEELNNKLAEEVEKRDKAVEEAVAMIVTLEARIEELTKGNSHLGRRAESQGFYSPPDVDYNSQGLAPAPEIIDPRWMDFDGRSINRMPSFLSDQSENTENLRNVYIGARGSLISLPRVSESALDMHTDPINGLSSPTLSVLSESSFVSVYGQKGQDLTLPSTIDEPLSLDGMSHDMGKQDSLGRLRVTGEARPVDSRTESPSSRMHGSSQFQPIASIMGGSPLQKIEMMDPAYSPRRKTPQPTNRAMKPPPTSDGTKVAPSLNRRATLETKREALRRVITDTPGGVSLHESGMPPTPDTISSATLNRMKHSNDTLGNRSFSGGSERNGYAMEAADNKGVTPMNGSPVVVKPAHTHKQSHKSPVVHTNDPWSHLSREIQRPRSADESTVSHRREHRWSMDSADTENTFESSLDIWLRAGGGKAQADDRGSPDMFGFPGGPSMGSWGMNAIMGHGNDPKPEGHPVNGKQLEELFSVQQALFGTGPPSPPNRRSSLQARAGQNNNKAEQEQKPSQHEAVQKFFGRRPRHARRNSDDAQMRAGMKTPVQAQFFQPPKQSPNCSQKRQQTQYPPITGQHGAQHGARNGLTRLWRRSFGAGASLPPADGPIPDNSEMQARYVPNAPQAQTSVSRNVALLDDDRSGATPPPIAREDRHVQGLGLEGDGYRCVNQNGKGEIQSPTVTEIQPIPQGAFDSSQHSEAGNLPSGSATGARRKWLPGFGRAGNLKVRTS
ncbi:unnamed protein product [Clonostachys rhizophaga]|uniref:Centrosomin N-terminal motif 1 domain-containing protein n=1 Tax=Clonostachys rhizophaga TaxID=160324 RepID=A0A9N9YDM8_9HYPO|nr:unnamed protein product [Clonostachys rhizophaga]